MPSANTELRDLAIQHALHVMGYSNALQKQVLAHLNDLERDAVEKLAARLASEKTLKAGPTKRIEDTIDEIRTLTRDVYSKTHEELEHDLIEFAGSEADYTNKAINRATSSNLASKLPSPQRLKTIVTEKPVHGRLLKPWLDGMGEGTANAVEQQIRLGLSQGEGIDKIVARVRGTQGFEGSRNSARTMVRTAVNSISNQAQQETWKANSHLISGWQFHATLDSRTTMICASHDGEVHPLGEGPIPPLHPNCRSITTAVLKSADDVSGRYSHTTRASMDGQVAATTKFESYMRDKGEAFQDQIMGPARADLWRRGKLNLNDFVRNYDEVIPLDELRRLHPEAFAGEAEATGAATATEAISAAPQAPETFSPLDPAITADKIAVQPKRAVAKALAQPLSRAAADPRYDPLPEYRGIKSDMFGKASIGSLTDEAASMVQALMTEADTIADAFNVPRLRGIKMGTGHIAAMGDGILSLNPVYINGYAAEIGAPAGESLTATLIRQRDALGDDLKAMADKLKEQRKLLATLTGAEREAAVHAYLDQADIYNSKIKEYNRLHKQIQKAARTDAASATVEENNWKPGDDVNLRPRVASDYFATPLERARATLYHELFHHVHQMSGRTGRRGLIKPPVERELAQMFFNKFNGRGPNGAQGLELKKLVATTYATTDPYEWACENFALYCMGRLDLVEPELKELFERLLKEAETK